MKRSFEADHAIRWQAKTTGQSHVAVALAAGVTYMTYVYGRGRIPGGKDGMFTMTIGTDSSLQDSMLNRLAMYAAGIVFLSNLDMAGTAKVEAPLCETMLFLCSLFRGRHHGTSCSPAPRRIALTGSLCHA